MPCIPDNQTGRFLAEELPGTSANRSDRSRLDMRS